MKQRQTNWFTKTSKMTTQKLAKKTSRGVELCGFVYPENKNFDSVGILMKYLEARCWIQGEKNKELITSEVNELISLSDKFNFPLENHVANLIDNYTQN